MIDKNNIPIVYEPCLKIALFDTAAEVFQIQNMKDHFNPEYYRKNNCWEHYEWLQNVYFNLPEDKKLLYQEIRKEFHEGVLINEVISIPNDSGINEILDRIKKAILDDKLPEILFIKINTFYTYFYRNFLCDYMNANASIFKTQVLEINNAIQLLKHPDILDFMEITSGIKFSQRYKVTFYMTYRPIGAMAWFPNETIISTIQSIVTKDNVKDSIFSVPFHEFSHNLFRTFTGIPTDIQDVDTKTSNNSNDDFKQLTEKLKNDIPFITMWEKVKDSYDWIGWCEENLVEGFSRFLEYKYYNKIPKQKTYVYDLEFALYLIDINFDPSKKSLKEVSLTFYGKKLN